METSFTCMFIRCFRLTILAMADISDYFNARKIAVIMAVIILVMGSVIYFSTDAAKRNNEMAYKEIFGENVPVRSDVDYAGRLNDSQNTKTALV
jgi:hypothetical protein